MRTPRIMLVTAMALLALGTAASSAEAQRPQTRQGFWAGLGMGWGSFGLGCDGCEDLGRTGSYSGYLKVGGTLSQSLLIGAEVNGWAKSEDGASLDLGNASAAAYWYPMPTGGMFLKGGLGYSRLGADDGVDSASDGGFGLTAGIGFDMRVGGNMSLTPVLNYFRGSFEGGSADVFQVGLGVTLH